jgi:hypothetical protein
MPYIPQPTRKLFQGVVQELCQAATGMGCFLAAPFTGSRSHHVRLTK